MTVVCDSCGKSFYSKSNLIRHQSSASCSQGSPMFNCESCLKEFTYKSNLSRHQKICKADLVLERYIKKIDRLDRKNIDKKAKIEDLRDDISKLQKKLSSKDEKNRELTEKNKKLKNENDRLKDQLHEQQGFVKGMKAAPEKKTIYNTAIHPKLVNLPISNIRPLTHEFIEERVNDGILTYEKAVKGYSGMLDIICDLITHENGNGEIERSYVCTDVSRNSFHRLLDSKKWKADKGGRYLNEMLDRFRGPMEEHKDRAYDTYKNTPHDSIEWNKIDWERKNVSLLYSGVVCKEGTGDREELVNVLRKEISKRAFV